MKIITYPQGICRSNGQRFKELKLDKDGRLIYALDKNGQKIPALKDPSGEESFYLETNDLEFPQVLKDYLNKMFLLAEQEFRQAQALQAQAQSQRGGSQPQAQPPINPLTIEDAANASDIIRACGVANGKLELEDAPHKWVIEALNTWGVKVYGLDAGIIKRVLESAVDGGKDRAERRREEKKK